MYKTRIFIFIYFCFSLSLQAQLKPIHTAELKANCEEVFIHTRTGIPIFKTSSAYVALNPVSFEQIWELKRQSSASLSETTSGEDFKDYFELPASNIVYIGNSLIDVLTGKVLADGAKDGIKRIASFHLFPSKNLLVTKVIAKGAYRLYGLDPIKNELNWKTDIDEIGGLNLSGMSDNDPVSETVNGLKPYISATGDIVYVHEKNMMLINPDDGKLKWSQPLEPGAVLFSKSGKLIAVAERRTGLGGVMDMSGGKKFGKKLVVVDAATGENAWKKEIKLDGNIVFMQSYHDGFIVAHEEGFNIYDFNSPKGEPQWKKDFAAKEISDVVEDGENIMVYYKDRRMLMNPVTGEDVWKKPEKLEEEIPIFTGGYVTKMGNINISRSGALIRITNPSTNAYKSISGERYAVNKDNNTLLATFDDRANAPTIAVGQKSVRATFVDLNTFTSNFNHFSFKKYITGVDAVKNGFFIYTENEFNLVRQEAGKLKSVKEADYPIPGSFGRGVTNVLVGSALAASMVSGAGGLGEAYVVGDANAYKLYDAQLNATTTLGNMYDATRERATLPTINKDYAFFFSKDDKDNLALFQVRKETGEQTASYVFDDKTPIYELDYVNGNIYYMNGKALKIYKLKV